MQFFIDLDTLKLVTSAADNREVVQVDGKRGDASPFVVTFLRDGVAEDLDVFAVLTFGAKPEGEYDSDAVVLDGSFSLVGDNYEASPSFNTAELNALFLINGDESDDPAYVDLMAEFTWKVGSAEPTSSKTFRFRVHNDVVRGDESGPTGISGGTPTVATAAVTGTLTSDGSTPVAFTNAAFTGPDSEDGRPEFENVSPFTAISAQYDGGGVFTSWALTNGSSFWTSTAVVDRPDLVPTGAWHTTTNPHAWKPTAPATGTPVVAITIPADGRIGTQRVDATHLYVVSAVTAEIPTWRKISHSAL